MVVAAIGIGAAVAIVVYSNRRPHPPEPVTSIQNINPNVVTKGGAGLSKYLKAGKNPVTLTSAGSEEDRTGRRFFTGVLIEGLESDRFTIKGDRLDMEGPEEDPKTFNVSGHVVVTTNDGLRMETETATYDDASGRLNLPRHVSFTKGRISGTALAGGYERDRDVVTLLGDATAHIQADTTGRGAADATATRMVMARDQHRLDLDEHARIVGDTQVLTSNAAVMSFTDDDGAIKLLELRGSAHATPKAGAPGAADQPAMAAENITMSFRPDGVTLQQATLAGQASLALAGASARSIRASSIDVSMAPDGHTLTALKAIEHVIVDLAATETTRARRITSATFDATGADGKGLTSARFNGSPVFTEQAEPSRTPGAAPAAPLEGRGTTLVLTLAGQLDAIELAEFQQNAEFHSEGATARGDIARYDQAHDVVHFVANSREAGSRPHVDNADIKVDAWTIDLDTVKQDLFASGEVTTQSRSQPASSGKQAPALFDAGDVVWGTSDSLKYTKSAGVATYTGAKTRAHLWQGASSIYADQIKYADATGTLDAKGHVDSTWSLDSMAPAKSTGKSAKPDRQEYTVLAESLNYDDAARRATFKAAPSGDVTLTMTDGEIQAAVLTLQLAAAARELEELHAERNAWARLSGDYESVSDTLVYYAAKDVYVLRGKTGTLAQVKSPNKETPRADAGRPAAPPMCTVASGQHFQIDRKAEIVDEPGVSTALRTKIEQACSVPLKRGGK